MALIKAINPNKRSLSRGIKYVTNSEKTNEYLISGKDCDAQTALEEMKATKEMYGKTEGRQYKHFVQSFKPEEKIDPAKAHQIGYEMAQKAFPGYEVLIATHTDTDHLHNHFIVNSVSFETGEKYRQSTHDLKKIKDLSNRICEREGLHVMKEDQTPGKSLSMNEYQVAMKGQSWKFQAMADIDHALDRTRSKEEFIKAMEDKGYKVTWNHKKYITYTTPDGKKVRDNKLHDPKYLKEAMENGFRKIKENEFQSGGTRSTDELRLSWTSIENGQIAGRANHNEQSSDRGQSRTDQEIRGERKGANSRKREAQRTYYDLKQETGRTTTNEPRKVGKGFQDNRRGIEKELRNQHENDSRNNGFSSQGQNNSKPKLEGKSETVRDTTLNNSGTSEHNARSIQTSDYIDNAIKTLGSSFEKVQQEEKAKAERMKEKSEQKVQESKKSRSKEPNLGPER